MNFLLLTKALLLFVLLFAPGFVAARRFGLRAGLPSFVLALLILGVSGLLVIHGPQWRNEAILGAVLAALGGFAAFAPRERLESLGRVTALPGGEIALIVIFSLVVPFGALEWAARFTTEMGWLKAHRPMKTWRKHGVEDWRRFHVTADRSREQDPVLFWRPKPGGAFSDQRFKSPLVEVPKPDGVFRVMAYGDSNTEGSPMRSWSANLQEQLDTRATPDQRYEVMNAGVAGYSSYQGLRRFEQESETYEPDLVLVSFGWNDVPEAVDQPDSRFQPTSHAMVSVLRRLFRYRLYLVIENYAVAGRIAMGAKEEYARVPLDEYIENMQSFSGEAVSVGAKVIFLTRPHREKEELLRGYDNWRSRVPEYNDSMRVWAKQNGAMIVDVQRFFQKNHKGMFGDETHFTEPGREAMGRLLVRYMEKQGLLPE